MTAKTWDFTYFYESEDDKNNQLKKWNSFDLTRLVIGDEVCPKTGLRHFQGKVTWKRSYRAPQLHKLLPKYHVEKSVAHNDFNYCMKDEIILSRDERSQGSRSDLRGAMEMVKEKKARLELMESHPTVVARYTPFLNAYEAELNAFYGQRRVIWVHGKTGTGKSRTIREEIPSVVSVSIKNGFFQGYRGEPFVVIDDFRAHDLPFSEFLKVLDRYPYTANIKGGEIRWNARIIYITSCYAPQDVYTTTESQDQLLRRITHTYEFPRDIDECRGTLRGLIGAATQEGQGGQEQPPGDI